MQIEFNRIEMKGCRRAARFSNLHPQRTRFLKFLADKLDDTSDLRDECARLPVGDDFILLISRARWLPGRRRRVRPR